VKGKASNNELSTSHKIHEVSIAFVPVAMTSSNLHDSS